MDIRRSAVVVVLVLGGLLVAAPAAHAQAVSTASPSVSGTVAAAGAEAVVCKGQASVTTTAVIDPAMPPPGVLVTIDVSGLSCVGASSGARYTNSGVARLTRLLVANDVIGTTFAVYKDAPGGFLAARTALLNLSLSFNTTTGALTSASATLGNL